MYPDRHRAKILAWVKDGLSDRVIAERLNVSPSTVRYWRERNGVVQAAKKAKTDPEGASRAGQRRGSRGGTSRMNAVWKRIHTWLAANAPEGYGKLRPGASAEAIRAVEKAMALSLPADVKASCRIYDGQEIEPGLIGGEGWCLFSLEQMVETWRRWSQADSTYAARVPVAWGGANDVIFVDLGRGAEEPGEVIVQRSDTDEPDPVASSFREWLEDFAEQLEDGELAY